MISVVIPLYNKEKQIRRTLETVLSQTFQDFEIVIVNDGSTDRSVDEVLKIKDERIHIFHQANAGVSAARNRGIEEAKGEYIAFLDADDEWDVNYLQAQTDLLNKYAECKVFACNYYFRNLKNRITLTKINNLPFHETDGILSNYFKVASCSNSPLWTSAVMVSKDAIVSIGGFPVGVKSGEDLLTWARLARKFKIAYTKKCLATFITTPSSNNTSKSEQRFGSEEFVLVELLKLYNDEDDPLKKGHLKAYILRWYKIYCVLCIENKLPKKNILLAIEALKFGGSLKVFIPMIILGTLPADISKKIFLKLRR